MQYYWIRLKKFIIYRILHVDDTPYRIAMGVAAGMFITWLPIPGFQMVLTVVLAALLRANKIVGLPMAWVSNPLTMVPMLSGGFVVGSWLLGGDHKLHHFLHSLKHALGEITRAHWTDSMALWWQVLCQFFWPLWLGCIIVGALAAVMTYVATYYGVIAYRRHRQHKLEETAKALEPKV